MAITKILARRVRLDTLINYALNPQKTDEKILTASQNCDLRTAYREMVKVKDAYTKPGGVQAYHIIQSFKAGEITPALSLEIAKKFCEKHLSDYQVVIGTHIDRNHVHNHIVFNSVSFKDGRKYHSSPASYYKKIRGISDRLCVEYGLSVVLEGEENRRGLTYAEWKCVKAGGMTLHQILEQDVQEVLSYALSYGEFLSFMEDKGYHIRHGKYLSCQPMGAARPLRPRLEGIKITESGIRSYLENALHMPDLPVFSPKQFRSYKPRPKAHGIYALYLHYLYVLGEIGRGASPPRQYRALQGHVKNIEQMQRHADFLHEHGIESQDDLQAYRSRRADDLAYMEQSRAILNSKKKRQKNQYDALAIIVALHPVVELYQSGMTGIEKEYEAYQGAVKTLEGIDITALSHEKASLYSQIADTYQSIREVKKDISLCDAIPRNIPHMVMQLPEDPEIEPHLSYEYRRK